MSDEKNNLIPEENDGDESLSLSELKDMLRGADDSGGFSLEDILGEYGVSSPQENNAGIPPFPAGDSGPEGSRPIEAKSQPAVEPEEGEVFEPPVKEAPARPVPQPFDPSEIHIDEKYFGPPELFNEAFVPSDKFIGEEDDETFMRDDPRPDKEKQKKRFRAPPKPRTDVTPAQAGAQLQKYVRFLGIRSFLVLLLCLPLIYITVAHRANLPLPSFLTYMETPHLYLFFSGGLLLAAMFLSVDVMTSGIRDLITLRPGMESLTALSCIIAALHNLSILIFPSWGGYLPYTAISALSLLFAMWGNYLKFSAMRWSYKNASSSQPSMMAREETAWQGRAGFVKFTAEDPCVFVEQTESPDAVERFSVFFSPLMIIAAAVFAFISTVTRESPSLFLWAFSAILAPAAAFPSMLSFSLPYFLTAKRLSLSGASLAGWTAARVLSDEAVLVVTDSDLFPPGTISLNGIKVLGDYPVDRVISYSASLISASGSGLSRIFSELLKGQSSAISQVDNFQRYESGGLGGEISGNRVLVGTSNFLLRMGIRVAREYNVKTGVLVSINHELVGIIALNYMAADSVREAVDIIRRHQITPLIATRDFNMTPLLLKDKLGISSDFAEFPAIEDRIALSEAREGRYGKPVAAVSREGLLPMAESVASARTLRSAVRRNIVIAAIAAVSGLLLMFFLCFSHSFSSASPVNLLAYMSVWLVPALLFSLLSGR